MLTPTGAARSQNVEAGSRFENERSKALCGFFTSVIRYALILIYGPEMRTVMEGARRRKIEMTGADHTDVFALFPEIDLEVNMASASVVSNAELRLMRNDGVIRQVDMAKRMAINSNMPEADMVALPWPDGVDRGVQLPNGPVPPRPEPKAVEAKK